MRLEVDAVTVKHGATLALGPTSLTFEPGSQTLLHGPAGCGKTTLLKLLAGLQRPTTGHVLWDGRDVANMSADERRAAQASFGMVFQSDALFDSKTVLENVLLPLVKRGVAQQEAQARSLEALAQVGLSDATQKRPEQLSGGMKKRVGVARAIVARPQVLLADDPFAGLDPSTERSIGALLLEVSKGRTLVVAQPDPTASLPLPRAVRLGP